MQYTTLSVKLETIAISKEQLIKKINYLLEINILQIKQWNDVNSFYIISNESESSESPLIQTSEGCKVNKLTILGWKGIFH